ncbi:MAG: tRNA lysidine(34) synthetase TilS [Prevotella sp.]|nr:tRNA lysidine(34) synthetase TilS [Prevotella sp.]
MLSKVKDYIKQHNLLNSNDLYIVALSGGADSVALLLFLDEMGYQVHAAHCNFHLRGAESDRDEAFCESLCLQKNIPFHRIHFDTLTYAETHHVSVEMAARELRYGYFEQLRKDIGASGICVAHHRDDSVETVLLNLIRGTGLRGLTGIQPRKGYILRPLLCVSRQEIEHFLQERGQEYVTDSTNLVADVLRNKLRLQIIPLLQTLNPAAIDNILRSTGHLAEAQLVLDSISYKLKDVKQLYFSKLEEFGSSEYALYEWAKQYGFNGPQVKDMLTAETGSVFSSSMGYDLLVDRDSYLVEPKLKPYKEVRIPEEGTYILDEITKIKVKKSPAYVSKNPSVATLDAQKVAFPLTVRRVEEGDRMQPYGMRGTKLLSDLLTDCKLSLFDKRRQLVVVDAQGVVIWAVGLRVSQQVAVTDHTSEVLECILQ